MRIEQKSVLTTIFSYGAGREWSCMGNNLYAELGITRNLAKVHFATGRTWGKYDRLVCEIINHTTGEVDRCEFPFSVYFAQKQCSPGAPKWSQFLQDNGEWYFSQYKHCLPTANDYIRICNAINEYVDMFC